VRRALTLAVVGSVLVIAGLAIWVISTVGHIVPSDAAGTVRLGGLGLVVVGILCGLIMMVALARRERPGEAEELPPASAGWDAATGLGRMAGPQAGGVRPGPDPLPERIPLAGSARPHPVARTAPPTPVPSPAWPAPAAGYAPGDPAKAGFGAGVAGPGAGAGVAGPGAGAGWAEPGPGVAGPGAGAGWAEPGLVPGMAAPGVEAGWAEPGAGVAGPGTEPEWAGPGVAGPGPRDGSDGADVGRVWWQPPRRATVGWNPDSPDDWLRVLRGLRRSGEGPPDRHISHED
jgi:hypothetical protein